MKSNRQARHILGLDHKISNQRKIVTAVSYTHLTLPTIA
mgnify:CR=1 FL=1